ncbi:hypothetical protein NPX13_g4677 [Xylaria arbuscula]|uniref:Uncharacterized protein n=1 Tax=Xylaria arbuscula TaxID=114810 RepID=A0A9W8TNV8_9PEZI|nr:hypothetical protein NPX13_g4677 [Xylaria arbuscula]
MSTNTLPTPGRPTFGVEVEFLCAALFDQADPDAGVEDLPPPLRIPRSQRHRHVDYVHERVKKVLDDLFETPKPPQTSFMSNSNNEIGAMTSFSDLIKYGPLPKRDLLREYRQWSVVDDTSVGPIDENLYEMVSVEINSPAQFSSPHGFKAISLAISTITSKFRCVVNIRCGLHVHVGCVEELLSLEQLRRLASLAYATEPLLYSLHDPIRRENYHCRPLQYDCVPIQDDAPVSDSFRGTFGLGDEVSSMDHDKHVPDQFLRHIPDQFLCHRYTGRDRRHGEEPLSAREQHHDEDLIAAFTETRSSGHFEPFTNESKHTRDFPDIPSTLDPEILAETAAQLATPEAPLMAPARERRMPRLRFQQDTAGKTAALRRILNRNGLVTANLKKREPPASIFDMVRSIYAQPATCHISSLLRYKYRPSMTITGHGCYNTRHGPERRTIEFRQGSGSLDAAWVATWAKICVGIFQFALNSPPVQFLDVLTKCDNAMKEGTASYDILDLLDDIGLFAEAEIAEKRLMENRYLWDLLFDEPQDELLFG